MICPCCSVAEVSNETDTCNLCGYSLKANVATEREGAAASPSGASAARTAVKVAPRGTAGAGTTIMITVKDGTGKPLKAGGDRVVVAVTGANRARPQVTDVGNGTYTATYTPAATGKDQLAITLNGVPIKGSPFATTVGPGPADPSQTSATVPSGTAGSKTTVTITARDANGNGLTSGGDTIDVAVDGANGSARVTVLDNGDSTYTASYTPTKTGTDELTITVNAIPVGGSPFSSSVQPGRANPRKTVVTMPGQGTPGQGTPITIKAHDTHKNPVTGGGDTVSVVVSGANRAKPAVTDVGNGTYTATYTPTHTGTDTVAITLRGKPIGGSPFTIVNEAGAAAPNQTAATVPAGQAGVPTTVVVTARDPHGNALTRGGDVVAVQVTGANTATPEVVDHGDSTYSASYTPENMGADQIAITMNGAAIIGSPFASIIEAGPANATKTQVTVPPTGMAGRNLRVSVAAHDANGNRIAVGGASLQLTVTGANSGVATEIFDNDDGTYAATYTAVRAGTDTLTIALEGEPVGGGPFRATIHAAAAQSAEAVATITEGRIGEPTTITVTTRDVFGNDVTIGGHELGITVAGANEGAETTCSDNQDGTYTATYVPTKSGTDYVAITLDGTTIGDSPCTSNVGAGFAAANKTTAMLPSASRAGALATLSIVVTDAYGNEIGTGGDTVAVTINGANEGSAVTVNDHGTGSYIATYTPTVAGIDELAVTLNGAPIAGSPFGHTVEAGAPDPTQSVATGPMMGKVGVLMTVSITTRDQYGNPLTYGGSDVSVSIMGANEAARTAVIDNRDGSYFATYTPTQPGKDRIGIEIGGKPIGSGPIRPVIAVGTASGAHSRADVPEGRVGKPTVIAIVALDVSGNELSAGGDVVTVGVSVANTVNAEVEDHGDGRYTATYTPEITGTDYVAIRINGAALGGSPFISQVMAGPTDPDKTAVVVPPSAVTGRPSTVFVRTRDGNGNEIKHGGHLLRVTVAGANDGTSLRVTDNEDGTYTATYTPTKAGEDTIALTIGAEAVGGGTFRSSILAGPPSVAQTSAEFPRGCVGTLTPIAITLRDAYRNPVPGRRDTLGLALSGANADAALQVTDNKDGSYSATYTPTIAGSDMLAVTLDGVPIRESPFRGLVGAGPGAADQSKAVVPAGVAGIATVIVLSVRDAFGNDADMGGDAIEATIDGANSAAHVDVADNQNGTYAIRYTPIRTGDDEIAVVVNGVALPPGPLASTVAPGAPDTGMTTADVPKGSAGRMTTVRVVARDACGNDLGHSAGVVAAAVSGANLGATVTVHDRGDGTYTLTYPPSVAGFDKLAVTLDGVAIRGSPFECTVEPGPIAPEDCTAIVPTGIIGQATTISVTARDAYGNPTVRAVDQLSVEVGGANEGAAVRVAELDNGVYVATYTPTQQGSDRITIAVRGELIANAPFERDVIQAMDTMPQLAGPPETRRLPGPRASLRPTMMCPRCSVAEISEETNQCELCGFSPTSEMPAQLTPASIATAVVPTASSLQERAEQELGARFEVRALLRHTSRSVIFLAQHRLRDELVALKIVPLQEPLDAAAQQVFEQAAARATGLRHDGVVPIYEYGVFPQFLWYSMEYVDGQALSEIVHQSGPMNFEACVGIVREAAGILESLHDAGVAHRNLKPANILIDTGRRVHITDMALPSMHGLSEYMAPEQFAPGRQDVSADQYSLALVMYECLLGHNPLIGDSSGDIASGGAQGKNTLASVRVDVPGAVQDALDKAMQKEPTSRFGSLREFGAAVAGGVTVSPTVPDKTEQTLDLPRVLMEGEHAVKRPVIVAVIAVLVAIGAIAASVMLRQPTIDEPARLFDNTRGGPTATSEASTTPAAADDVADSPGIDAAPGAERAADAATTGRLSVASNPSGLLFVDGRLIGRTPATDVPLQPGAHVIRILQPGFATYERQISVEAGGSVELGRIALSPRALPGGR